MAHLALRGKLPFRVTQIFVSPKVLYAKVIAAVGNLCKMPSIPSPTQTMRPPQLGNQVKLDDISSPL
ncbi:hypothetical protein QC764_0019080 [Podospora pseudoanserina]|uniref:Uncharacterized protein n=1 Tax=Podospora pseudoanserina TaxID=2609844 RepID=A0ABR0IPT8_9PEZI|nr:hypothetical protein QC764_0019080 [Podospora pseudoanserina]